MTSFASPRHLNKAEATPVAPRSELIWGLPVAVVAGCLLALAMTLGKAIAVWRTGIFFDPDDAMRAVEVRDLLSGQGWFDLVQHRLAPGHPFPMHWSRLADLPLAASVLLLRQLTDPDTAERITRLVEPSAFFVVFLITLARLARDLVGRRGPLAATLLAAGSLEVVGNFVPGHIHHHALQLMLLALLAKSFSDGLDPARPGRMVWAGCWAALSLAINLQNLPFVIGAASVLGCLWASQGDPLERALGRFGWGLGMMAAAVFLLQVSPSRYLEGSCDAFAAPHLLAAAATSVSFMSLAGFYPRLRSTVARFAALGAAGIMVLLLLGLTYPACLGDPYGAVDPLVRERWMGEVGEALPLGRLLLRDPWGTMPIVIELGLGMACLVQAVRAETGLSRTRWIAMAALALISIAGTLWQVRVASSAEMFACLGGAWWLTKRFGRDAPARPYATLLCFVAGLGLTQAGWASVLSVPLSFGARQIRSAGVLPPVDPEACFAPASYETLRGLPTGPVLSTIDPGAHILAYTRHAALAAPYHRDTYGIRLALLVFEASPAEARALVLESGARYLALCLASPETHEIVARAPDGLGAGILAGRLPPWLEALPSGSGPLMLFRVAPDLRGTAAD